MSDALIREFEIAFAPDALPVTGETRALLVTRGGVTVAERYGDGISAGDALPSWSMAKSVLHAVVGLLVGDGRLRLNESVDVPQWPSGDPREAITLDQLLRMSSGLAFREDYVDGANSDVIPMLFGAGKDDVAAFAASLPLANEPGAVWSYSSGTSNVISGIIARLFGNDAGAYEAYMRERLFDRIGMTSAQPRFDAAGTWIGSSFVFATARDFGKFGQLYARGGVWDGDRILPEGWVEYARAVAPACPTAEYGAHWWIFPERQRVFHASGYEGQRIVVSPEDGVVIVRLGKSDASQKPAVQALMLRVLDTAVAG